jgi:hypothetical protein
MGRAEGVLEAYIHISQKSGAFFLNFLEACHALLRVEVASQG